MGEARRRRLSGTETSDSKTRMWGYAVVMFPTTGKIFRFTLGEGPKVPPYVITEIKDTFDVTADEDAAKKLISAFANTLISRDPGSTPSSQEDAFNLATYLMTITHFLHERYWIVIQSDGVATFQGVRGETFDSGRHEIERMINETIYGSSTAVRH